jgi:filamentous hemagglutinin family protein
MKLNFFFLSKIIISSAIILTGNTALAEITPDTTLPNNSQVKQQNNIQFIEGGTQAGSNLFHSFKEFSVLTNSTVKFNNAGDIQNILTRVTGGTVSNIDGLIQASGTANLFLINPNGITFGKNARLEIGGSFIGSTANSIKFADGFEFNAKNPQSTSLLTINVPVGLQLGNNPGNIVNQSQGRNDRDETVGLTVPKGKTLALVGGNVSLDGGRLTAPGGQVQLGGLATEGTVDLKIDGNNLSLNFPNNVVRSDVSLDNGGRINTTSDGGGSIAINARNLNVLGGSQISTGIGTGTGTVGSQAGDINLNATGEAQIDGQRTRIENNVNSKATGNSGNLNITTGSLRITNGAALSASSFGGGNAGNVDVRASNLVELTDSAIFSAVEAGGVGKGGNININAASLSLKDSAQLITIVRGAEDNQPAGQGDAGNVKVDVTGAVTIAGKKGTFPSGIRSQLGTGAVGNGGNISISSGSLSLSDGAEIDASTLGRGNAGNVDVRASNFVELTGSDIFSRVGRGAVGNGGNISISSGSLSLSDGAELAASSFGGGNAGNVDVRASNFVELIDSNIFSAVEAGGVGKGGNININAASLSLQDSAQLITIVRGAKDNQPAGQGDAGNVKVDVTGAVTITGVKNGFPSGIRSLLGRGAVGNGGNISISSGSLSLSNGAEIDASTFGGGNAGNVDVRASDFVELIDGDIFSTVEARGVGKGGNININAASLSLKDGAQLLTSVRRAEDNQPAGQGDAGNVKVDITGAVTITGVKNEIRSGIRSVLGTGAVGNGGNINISSGSLSLSDGAELAASSFGGGNAGNVDVRASDFVELIDGNIFSTVEARGVGKGGNININAASLSLKDSAQLITIVRGAENNQTAGQGDAGNVKVDVTGAVTIAGKKGTVPSGIRSLLGRGAVGNGGNISISSGSLSLSDGAEITASTLGRGNAGDVDVRASDFVELIGSNIFSTVETGAVGNGGNINISSGSLSLSDGAEIDASTFGGGNAGNVDVRASNLVELTDSAIFSAVGAGGVGKGGNININAASLSLKDSAQLITIVREAKDNQPAGQGDAGNVKVDVTGAVIITGVKGTLPSGIRSELGRGAIGNGGNISISSGSLSLSDGAEITASTLGRGNAGNIKINANDFVSISGRNLTSGFDSSLFVDSSGLGRTGDIEITSPTIRLENNAILNATSTSGNGGNIRLNPTDLLLLSNNSLISATAGTQQQPGDGGNITINSPNGFVVGFPLGNSDIIANAFEGSGGQVKINAFGIFGMQQRNREELQRLNQLDPRELPTNDITAFSQQNPTLSGIVQINTPDVDPSRGVAELPQYLVNAAGLINQNFCALAYNSSFTITGRGGIAPSPFDVFVGESTWEDWRVNPIATRETAQSQRREEEDKKSLPETPIIEAQGWIVNKKGQVELVASTPNATPHILQNSPNGCLLITRD